MPALLLYLLKANVALVLFYMAYHLVLRKLTFYHLNRGFLLFGLLFSAFYPLIDLSELFNRHQELAAIQTYAIAIPAWSTTTPLPEQAPVFDYWQLPVLLFWLGTVVMAARLLLQFASLYQLHRTSVPAAHQGIPFRKVSGISEAFSFWQTIYLAPNQHKAPELESILRHEQVHVRGWHTLDVLLAELSTVFYWFNPGVWLLKKALKENLEFIADQHVVDAGVDRVAYQYLLLKVVGASQPQIANQFNFPSLKRRIAMMNKKPSTRPHLLKFLAVLPVAAVLLLAFNGIAKPQADFAASDEAAGYTKVGPAIYLKSEPTFAKACWTAPNTLTITPVAGSEEVYQLDNEQDIAAAYKAYGLYLPDNDLYDKTLASIPGAANAKRPQVVDEYKDFYARNPQVRKLEWTTNNKIVVRLKTTEEIYSLDDQKSRAAAERKYGKLPSTPPPASVMTQEEFDIQSQKGLQERSEKIFIPEETDYYKDKNNLPVEYTNFLGKNPSIKKVGWTIDGQTGPKEIVLFMNSGSTERYDLTNAQSMATAESKYGKLPALLPPPPPVKVGSPTKQEELPAARLEQYRNPSHVAPLDTPAGTADLIRKIHASRLRAGEHTNKLIVLLANSQGKGMDVYAELSGSRIDSVRVLATAR